MDNIDHKVHKCIKACILELRSKEETIDIIARELNIGKAIIRKAWKVLEIHYVEFFKNYYRRLVRIDGMKREMQLETQIMRAELQVEMSQLRLQNEAKQGQIPNAS